MTTDVGITIDGHIVKFKVVLSIRSELVIIVVSFQILLNQKTSNKTPFY
jgi:hypothetical protein